MEQEQEQRRAVSIGAVMTGGAYVTQRSREEDDFYPTPSEATDALMAAWKPKGNVWEPCAGNGALADRVKLHMNPESKLLMTDINPRREDIRKKDFLSLKGEMPGDFSIITNPPFKFAEKFIRQGFSLGVQRQAILLKSTFFHASRRTGFFYEFRPSHIFALNWRLDFMNLKRPVMECAWFVWDRPSSETTQYDILSKAEK